MSARLWLWVTFGRHWRQSLSPGCKSGLYAGKKISTTCPARAFKARQQIEVSLVLGIQVCPAGGKEAPKPGHGFVIGRVHYLVAHRGPTGRLYLNLGWRRGLGASAHERFDPCLFGA